jgi:hypothetical protein
MTLTMIRFTSDSVLRASTQSETFVSSNRPTMSVFNASRLLNKTVVITGASAGIGAVRVLRLDRSWVSSS